MGAGSSRRASVGRWQLHPGEREYGEPHTSGGVAKPPRRSAPWARHLEELGEENRIGEPADEQNRVLTSSSRRATYARIRWSCELGYYYSYLVDNSS